MSATAKYVLYYNIITEDLYDENGSYMGSSAFNVFFDNTVNVELHYMTDTSSDDMSNWIPWTGLQGNTTGSSICFDDDYLHASLGSVSEDSSVGSTILKVSSTLSENNVNPSDNLILYTADGGSVSLPYTGYTYASGVYSFELTSALSVDATTGLDVRVPQALLLKVYSDEIDQTKASTGVFKFSMNVLSHKLLNRLDYSNTTKVSGMFEHQIYSDGENVATFTFPMSVTNLIDYRGNANVPADGTWADKAYVDSKIPTKVSELQNDAGYISEQTDPVYTADKPLIALKQELFSKSFNDLSDIPNTIAGYGITDAYINDRVITIGQNYIEIPEVTSDIIRTAIGIDAQTGSSLKYLNEKGNFVQVSSVMSVNGVTADINGNVSLNLESIVDIQQLAQQIKAVKSINGVFPDDTTLQVTLTANDLKATVYESEVNVQQFLNTVVTSVNQMTPTDGAITLDASSINYYVDGVASGTVADKLQYILSNLGTGAIKTINGQLPDSEGNIQINFVKSVDGFTPNANGQVQMTITIDGTTMSFYDAFETLRYRIQQLEQGGGSGSQLVFNPPLSLDGNVVNIDMSFSNVTNTPTTLDGYGITDAQINGRVITLGGNSIEVPEGGSTYVLTKEAVDEVIGASATGSATMFYNQQGAFVSIDLTGYATESFVTSQGYITISALSGYATESFVTSQGYITVDALSGYATTTDVSTAVSNHNTATDAHTALFEGKENVGIAQGLVDGHNQSSEAHSALFEDKADKTELSAYLPLAGGTMTGTIVTTETSNTITSSNNRIIMSGGSTYLKGGNLRLYGDGYDGTLACGFALVTHANEAQSSVLMGNNSGTITWTGNRVEVGNGSGTVTIPYDAVNLNIISSGSTSGYAALRSSTNSTDGAYIAFYGKDNSNSGRFGIYAADGTNRVVLVGTPAGGLTWNSKDITLGYPKYSSGISVGTVSSYTVAQDGWLYAWSRRDGKYWHLCVGGVLVFSTGGSGYDASTCFIPVKKGDVIKTYNGYSGQEEAFAVAMKLYPNR